MPDLRRRTCRECEKTDDLVGPISWRGYCAECGDARMLANNEQVRDGAGPFAEHRLRRSMMAARRALVALEREGV